MLRMLTRWACPRGALQWGYLQPLTRSYPGWWLTLSRHVRSTLRADLDVALDAAILGDLSKCEPIGIAGFLGWPEP
jgi:hypothetical protein